MNWPEGYKVIGDTLIADIRLPEEQAGIISLNKDPRKQERKPDCYEGKVTETGESCKLTKVGDQVVFTRWIWSQSDVDDDRIAFREVDLVVVNGKCVNNFCAVKLYEPFKKSDDLIRLAKREQSKNFWGQVIDIDHIKNENKETKNLKEGDIIFFQYMEDYQYRVGAHTMVFKNIPDVIIAKMEAPEEKEMAVNG